jgi:hypothetical protein
MVTNGNSQPNGTEFGKIAGKRTIFLSEIEDGFRQMVDKNNKKEGKPEI